MTVRPFIFWPHLVAGVLAGFVILIMSVTGVLLMYEKQMIAWADGGTRVAIDGGAPRLSVEDVLRRVRRDHGGATPGSISMPADAAAPALVTVERRTWLVDPYSGATLGESAPRLRRVFRIATDWHRWLAVADENRPVARAITGWANVIFLFIIVSGMYLWLPRRWSWRHVRAVAFVNVRLTGKARDFNWHNAIGIWCAVPLFFIVISITPVSFPWANGMLFGLVGESPPPRRPPQDAAGRTRAAAPADAADRTAPAVEQEFDGINRGWTRAEQQMEGWRTITLRLPAAASAPLTFTIDRGSGGQPQHRGTLTVHRSTGDVIAWEPFESLSRGRQLRSIARFLHTGEVLGPAGQTVAGLASAGGAFLVWTGLSLAYRRFFVRSRAEHGRERAAA